METTLISAVMPTVLLMWMVNAALAVVGLLMIYLLCDRDEQPFIAKLCMVLTATGAWWGIIDRSQPDTKAIALFVLGITGCLLFSVFDPRLYMPPINPKKTLSNQQFVRVLALVFAGSSLLFGWLYANYDPMWRGLCLVSLGVTFALAVWWWRSGRRTGE